MLFPLLALLFTDLTRRTQDDYQPLRIAVSVFLSLAAIQLSARVLRRVFPGSALVLLVGLLFALSAVGVDLTAPSVLGGALGAGLCLGLQKLAPNLAVGRRSGNRRGALGCQYGDAGWAAAGAGGYSGAATRAARRDGRAGSDRRVRQVTRSDFAKRGSSSIILRKARSFFFGALRPTSL